MKEKNISSESVSKEKTNSDVKRLMKPVFAIVVGYVAVFIFGILFALYFQDNLLVSELEKVEIRLNSLQAQTQQIGNGEAESGDLTDEEGLVSFKYEYDGVEYLLTMENPDELKYSVEERDGFGEVLVVNLSRDVNLVVHQQADYTGGPIAGGAYGDTLSELGSGIYRNTYLGVESYVLDADDEECSERLQAPCVIPSFHVGDDGSLKAFLEYDSTPDDKVYEMADNLIKSYNIRFVE